MRDRYERLAELVNDDRLGTRTSGSSAARVELMVSEGEGRKDAATHRLSGRGPDNRLVHFYTGLVTARARLPRPT